MHLQTRAALLFTFVLLGTHAAPAQQPKAPTEQEKQQWARAAELTKACEQSLGEFAGDVKHERSYAGFRRGQYHPYHYEFDTLKKRFEDLAVAEKEIGPLKETIAAIEAKYGTSAEAIETKVWAEYGKPIVQGEPGFSRHLSPDRKKWLDIDVDWPFKFYKDARAYLDAPAAWRKLVVKFAGDEVKQVLENHQKDWDPNKGHSVWTDRQYTRPLAQLLVPLGYIASQIPDDAALKQLQADVQAALDKWKQIEQDVLDAQEWKPHEENHGDLDPDDLVDALRERLKKWDPKQEPIAIRISSDWDVYSKNILGEPVCYYFWADVAYENPADKLLDIDSPLEDVVYCYQLKVYTPEAYPAKKGPPLEEIYHDSTYLIRPGNVSQQGGGFFGTLVKLVLGLVCCFMFLGVVGGGGYFAYKQMNAQKAAGDVAPGAAQGPPPGAPPATPPAAPTG